MHGSDTHQIFSWQSKASVYCRVASSVDSITGDIRLHCSLKVALVMYSELCLTPKWRTKKISPWIAYDGPWVHSLSRLLLLNKYLPHDHWSKPMNACSMIVIQTLARFVMVETYQGQFITSRAFTTPLLWHHGIVKCPLDAHGFRMSLKVGHLFHEYCEFRHTSLFTYCFRLLFSREVCIFGCSHIFFIHTRLPKCFKSSIIQMFDWMMLLIHSVVML